MKSRLKTVPVRAAGAGRPAEAEAEGLALEAVMFLVSDDQRLSYWQGATGLDVETIKAALGALKSGNAEAGRPVLRAALEHLSQDEGLLLVFAAHSGRAAAEVLPALARLSCDWERLRG